MLESKFIKEHLERSYCYKCGSSLGDAKLMTISNAPMAFLAHAVCSKCESGTMVTITPQGSGTIPVVTDLVGEEIKEFIAQKNVSYEELFSLHKLLKKDNIWNLLQKKEKNSVKKRKA